MAERSKQKYYLLFATLTSDEIVLYAANNF